MRASELIGGCCGRKDNHPDPKQTPAGRIGWWRSSRDQRRPNDQPDDSGCTDFLRLHWRLRCPISSPSLHRLGRVYQTRCRFGRWRSCPSRAWFRVPTCAAGQDGWRKQPRCVRVLAGGGFRLRFAGVALRRQLGRTDAGRWRGLRLPIVARRGGRRSKKGYKDSETRQPTRIFV